MNAGRNEATAVARLEAAQTALTALLDLARNAQHHYRPAIEAPQFRTLLAAAAIECALAEQMAGDTADALAAPVLALGLDDLGADLARARLALLRSAGRAAAAGRDYLAAFEGTTPRAVRHGAIVAALDPASLQAPAAPALSASAAVAAILLGHGGNAALAATYADTIAAGSCRAGIAALEHDAGYDFDNLRTRLQRSAGASAITGAKPLVEEGAAANVVFVSVRVMETAAGDGPDDDGRSLYCIETDRPGVKRQARAGIDGPGYADFVFERVEVREVDRVGPRGDATPLLVHGIDAGCVALCAEATGLMAGMVGRIARVTDAGDGKARARLARMLVHLTRARAALRIAEGGLAAHDAEAPAARMRAVSLAKHVIGEAGRFIGEHGVREGDAELRAAFARLTAIDLTWGDAAHHFERYAGLLGR